MDLTIELNPEVKRLFEEATEAAKPLWLALFENGVELFSRREIILEPDGIAYSWFNANQIEFAPTQHQCVVEMCGLSRTPLGAIIASGPVGYRGTTDHPRLMIFDRIFLPRGNCRVTGKLPS